MFKKIILLCMTFFCLKSQGIAFVELPDEFTVTQHWFSWTTAFTIGTKDMKMGTVHSKFFSLSWIQYDFYDNDEKLQASGKMRWFSWGATFDVTDAEEQSLGRVEKKFTWFFPTFHFISNTEQILAEACLNFWGTTFTVIDPVSQQTIATMHRNFLRLKDDWTVNIINRDLFVQNGLDPRFFVIVMAFQSDDEAWNRQQHNKNNNIALVLGGNVRKSDFESKMTFIKELKTSKSKKPVEDQVEGLRILLNEYSHILPVIEPSEEDFESVDKAVTAKMEKENTVAEENESEFTYLERGFMMLLPMLDSDELSASQKNALFKMLDHRLNQA